MQAARTTLVCPCEFSQIQRRRDRRQTAEKCRKTIFRRRTTFGQFLQGIRNQHPYPGMVAVMGRDFCCPVFLVRLGGQAEEGSPSSGQLIVFWFRNWYSSLQVLKENGNPKLCQSFSRVRLTHLGLRLRPLILMSFVPKHHFFVAYILYKSALCFQSLFENCML